MEVESNIEELIALLETCKYEVPPINFFDWNEMTKVRPCLEMLVKVIIEEEVKLCYLDVIETQAVWIDTNRNKFAYEMVNWWMPISIHYMEGATLGELLKVKHEKLQKTEKLV